MSRGYAWLVRVAARSIAASVLLLSFQVSGGQGAAFADWKVHRSAEDAGEQLARVLAAHPDRRDLAARLMRGGGRARQDRWLRRFEDAAAERPKDFAAQLALAQLLLAAGRWQLAADRFQMAAGLAPLDVAPRWGRARALRGAGHLADAQLELRAALALSHAPEQTYQLAGELIAVALSTGDLKAEIEGRRAAVRVRPVSGAIFELAAALNNSGQHGEAAALLAERAATMARTPEQRARWALAEGRARAAGGDLEAAAAALTRAVRLAPAQALSLRQEIWVLRVEVARRRGTLEEVARELSRPSDGVEWVARARVADERGELRGAWAALEEALRLAPRDLELRKREIAVARRIGTPAEVSTLYERLIEDALVTGGGEPAVIIEGLDGLWELGRPELAGHGFDRVLARRGLSGPGLLRALGETAARWGDDRRAERCWTALLRRNSKDELAVVALGEIQLQRGQRRSALDTWRRVLRGTGAGRAEAHARLAEILGDHDFPVQALAEARLAVTLVPWSARFHRLLATLLERQGRLVDAETEWQTVLRLAKGPAGASDRNDARTRLLGLWIRGGTAHLEAKLHAMEQLSTLETTDREMLLFLVQAQLRTGRTDAALALMERVLAEAAPAGTERERRQRHSGDGGVDGDAAPATTDSGPGGGEKATSAERKAGADRETDADLILLLVRTLRQVHRSDEAMRWLEQLSARFPARARDAQLQLADLALAEHADQRAQHYAEQAASGAAGDARVLLRAAAVQERLGHLDQAALMYRRLLGGEHRDPAAALGLASLLARQGETEEQRSLLHEAVRNSGDEEVITTAGTRAIVLAEASGTGALEALEAFVADTPDLNGGAPASAARRRVLASILWRLVPPVYRHQAQDAAAAAKLNKFARHGVRALLELANAPDAVADARAVEILGMLGRAEAVPALSRLLLPDLPDVVEGKGAPAPAPGPPRPGATTSTIAVAAKDDLASTIVVALGRLGGELARATLEAFAQRKQPASRLPLLWALGRVGPGGPVAVERARQELTGNATDGAIVACLTLGRIGGERIGPLLLSVARDPHRPAPVREAAVLGLGLGRHRPASPGLGALAATADGRLSHAARVSLGLLGDAAASIPDEAVAIVGGHVDGAALLDALQGPSEPTAWLPAGNASPTAGQPRTPLVPAE